MGKFDSELRKLGPILLLLVLAGPALSAELTLLGAAASISVYDGPDDVLPGDDVTMGWRVDLDAVDANPDPSIGIYLQDFPGIDLAVVLSQAGVSNSALVTYTCERLRVEIFDNVNDGSSLEGDSYSVAGELCTNEFQDQVELLAMTLHDPTGLALDSDTQILPDLADFGGSVGLPNPIAGRGCTAEAVPPCDSSDTGFSWLAEDVFLVTVPEPEGGLRAAIAAIALLGRRRLTSPASF